VKLAAKFINKMVKHIDNSLVPMEIPALPRTFSLSKLQNVSPSLFPMSNKKNSQVPNLPHWLTLGNVRQMSTNLVKRSQGRSFSDKSLKMGLFHVKKGTSTVKALPDKS
jgi:hypothetical protein